MKFAVLRYLLLYTVIIYTNNRCFGQIKNTVSPLYNITLKEAHSGSLEIDRMLLNSYKKVSVDVEQFYLNARSVFINHKTDFTDKEIIEAALNYNMSLIGGPILGDLKQNGVSIWLRPSRTDTITIKVTDTDHKNVQTYIMKPDVAGKEQRIKINKLSPKTKYNYFVLHNGKKLAGGTFLTAPKRNNKSQVRLVFGSCFHKIGLHNPNLINTIIKRKPHAMMLLGDIAADDRNKNVGMHQSDYLLRNLSKPWQKLAGNIPLYASWDDHDYRDNDLSGVSGDFTDKDKETLRTVWRQNWNNPPSNHDGIYFNTRIGQVELIMLDTRSCRKSQERGKYGSYLGLEQLEWLKNTLRKSDAAFKVISSGTMWSDYISNGKDSWGTWDTIAREEIYTLIEKENISGVLLISGDRHGARGFTIPRDSGFKLYEFEVASLGGAPGPNAMAADQSNQLFGYEGLDLKAFGEFTFNFEKSEPKVTFRLINEFGEILEEHSLSYKNLSPWE